MTLVQMGVITDKQFIADNLNKSTPESLSIALRRSAKQDAQFAKEQQEAKSEALQMAAQQQQQQVASAKEMQRNLMINDSHQKELDRSHDIDKIFAKSIADKMGSKK